MFKSQKKVVHENPLLNVPEVELVYKSNVKIKERSKIITSWQAYDLLMKIYNPESIEHREFFWVLYLNQAGKPIGAHLIGMGGITGTVVDVRTIYQGALLANACSIIISHNHPSGNLMPSDADKSITKLIKDAGEILEIKLKDHLIVTPYGYYSFADEGQL